MSATFLAPLAAFGVPIDFLGLAAGIVHGDLKRENILLKSSTAPHGFTSKVADFGLARNMQGLESYYATNVSGDEAKPYDVSCFQETVTVAVCFCPWGCQAHVLLLWVFCGSSPG